MKKSCTWAYLYAGQPGARQRSVSTLLQCFAWKSSVELLGRVDHWRGQIVTEGDHALHPGHSSPVGLFGKDEQGRTFARVGITVRLILTVYGSNRGALALAHPSSHLRLNMRACCPYSMTSPSISTATNVDKNSTSPLLPPTVPSAPANVSPVKKRKRKTIASQYDENVWGLSDDTILGEYSFGWCWFD